MKKRWMIPSMLIVSLLLVGMAMAPPNAPGITWWVIGGGGGSETSGAVSLDGTIGQWAVGSGASGDTQLGSGFWGGGGSVTGDVDLHRIFLPVVLGQHP
jgi:hypothetical protein